MAGARLATAVAGVVLSIVVSLIVWLYSGIPFLFFLVPFIPFLFRRGTERQPSARECPVCDFQTRDQSYEYCPRDGHRLAERGYDR
jgi:hypothetical protein